MIKSDCIFHAIGVKYLLYEKKGEEKTMSYITTISGIHFDPVEPEAELIKIEDIAHALSRICRGNGHVKEFHSVAQHSLECLREARARGESEKVQLGCLLHDASEAFLSDVTRPVKQMLTEYLAVEDRLQDMIWEKYLGSVPTAEERKRIFAIDDDLLSLEFRQNMAETIDEKYKNVVADIHCGYRDMDEVEREFLEEFGNLTANTIAKERSNR